MVSMAHSTPSPHAYPLLPIIITKRIVFKGTERVFLLYLYASENKGLNFKQNFQTRSDMSFQWRSNCIYSSQRAIWSFHLLLEEKHKLCYIIITSLSHNSNIYMKSSMGEHEHMLENSKSLPEKNNLTNNQKKKRGKKTKKLEAKRKWWLFLHGYITHCFLYFPFMDT